MKIRNTDDISKLGTIMSVWAHPDDESFCAAGIMYMAVQNGQQVICVTATRGEEGVRDESRWPKSKLGLIREKELKACLNTLGVKDHHFLDYVDGRLKDCSKSEAVDKISRLIDKYKPDTILTFGPDGLTGHDDHKTVSEWVKDAAKTSNAKVYHTVVDSILYDKYLRAADQKFDIYFNIDKPPILVEDQCDIAFNLPPKTLATKLKSLKAMPSQTEEMFESSGDGFIGNAFGVECFVEAD